LPPVLWRRIVVVGSSAKVHRFWATHTGAELGLLLIKDRRRHGVEVKFQDAPRLTPSMRIALADLRLERLTVLYPGDLRYELDRRVTVMPLAELAADPGVVEL
jgi:hypothetical protein